MWQLLSGNSPRIHREEKQSLAPVQLEAEAVITTAQIVGEIRETHQCVSGLRRAFLGPPALLPKAQRGQSPFQKLLPSSFKESIHPEGSSSGSATASTCLSLWDPTFGLTRVALGFPSAIGIPSLGWLPDYGFSATPFASVPTQQPLIGRMSKVQ